MGFVSGERLEEVVNFKNPQIQTKNKERSTENEEIRPKKVERRTKTAQRRTKKEHKGRRIILYRLNFNGTQVIRHYVIDYSQINFSSIKYVKNYLVKI